MPQRIDPILALDRSVEKVRHQLFALARCPDLNKASWRGVKEAVLETATTLRVKTGQTAIPIDLAAIGRERKIREVILIPGMNSRQATLAPVSGGFEIRLPAAQARTRQRVSVAHEIGHTLFFDIDKSPPVRMVASSSPVSPMHPEEEICFAFSRELLMPADLVTAELPASPAAIGELDILLLLAERFEVSVEFAARRLMWDLALFETEIVIAADFAKEGPHKKALSSWMLKGKAARRLTREQKRILGDIEQAIKQGRFSSSNVHSSQAHLAIDLHDGEPGLSLDAIGSSCDSTVRIAWKTRETASYTKLLAILDFPNSHGHGE